MNTIHDIYNSLPPEVWALLLGTPAVVGFVNLCKKLFGTKSKVVIHSLTFTASFLVTALPHYILNDPAQFTVLGKYAAVLFAAANFLYVICKALVPFFAAVKQYEDKKAAADAVNAADTTTTPAVVAGVGGSIAPVSDPTIFEG